MFDRTTIFALSSGQVPSAIAIVRVSGPRASDALGSLCGRLPPARVATRVLLKASDRTPIDEAIALWFPAPGSATGEDTAEFHLHGGRAVVAALVHALAALDGLRPAEPGEFTRRAFENGKLDLVAAEAVDDLIHADTERQRRQALNQLGGLLGDRARDWRQRLIDASALVEASIDFSDEGDVAGELMAPAQEAIAALRTDIAAVLAASGRSERLREGLVVAIAGPPNVGKSTLMNRFARREVAIVSPYAGTTRDLMEVRLDLDGYPVTMIDTAGLRDAADPVEQEGIRRAIAQSAAADLVLWLSDSESAQHPDVPSSLVEVWRVRTKSDLTATLGGAFDFIISASTGAGMDRLQGAIAGFAAQQFPGEAGLITRQRHRKLLEDAVTALVQAENQSVPELVAEDLRAAITMLGRLLGRVDVDDVLGSIFSRFCIGK